MIIWLVQTNLGIHSDYVTGINEGCRRSGNQFIGFRGVPFSDEVPTCDSPLPKIAYGSVDVMRAIHNSGIHKPGVFYNDDFLYSKYVENLGDLMLNNECGIIALKDVITNRDKLVEQYGEDDHIFIRPEKDDKEFVGEPIKMDELTIWIEKVSSNRTVLDMNTNVVISRPYKLNKEWRAFIVNKQIVDITRYKKDDRLDISNADIPTDLLEFTSAAIKKWTPHPICVVDLCETGGEYYIVEFNCFNSSGFYRHNIPKIVQHISDYVEKIGK